MFPSRSAIAKGYGEVCAVIPLACKISIAFLAMLLSSCSLFLHSDVVHDLTEKVANLRERFDFCAFEHLFAEGKCILLQTWSYAPFQFGRTDNVTERVMFLLVLIKNVYVS